MERRGVGALSTTKLRYYDLIHEEAADAVCKMFVSIQRSPVKCTYYQKLGSYLFLRVNRSILMHAIRLEASCIAMFLDLNPSFLRVAARTRRTLLRQSRTRQIKLERRIIRRPYRRKFEN